jgi:hypothetical protein
MAVFNLQQCLNSEFEVSHFSTQGVRAEIAHLMENTWTDASIYVNVYTGITEEGPKTRTAQ